MTYSEFFAEIKGKFLEADVSNIKDHLTFQFNIIGEAQGIFYIELKNENNRIEPYVYNDRDAMFTCTAETLREIEMGKLDPVDAANDDKIKVEGNIEKAKRFGELVESHLKAVQGK